MATEPNSMRTQTPAADLEGLAAQLVALRSDMAGLSASLGQAATRRGQAMAHDVSEGITEAAHYLGRKGHDAEVRLEKAVGDNPYIALGIAAGLGLILGAMSRR